MDIIINKYIYFASNYGSSNGSFFFVYTKHVILPCISFLQVQSSSQTLQNLSDSNPHHNQSQSTSTILLHPPVQLDTSGLSAPPLSASIAESRDNSTGSRDNMNGSRDHSSAGSQGSQGQQRVTWQLGAQKQQPEVHQQAHDTSFASVGSGR